MANASTHDCVLIVCNSYLGTQYSSLQLTHMLVKKIIRFNVLLQIANAYSLLTQLKPT